MPFWKIVSQSPQSSVISAVESKRRLSSRHSRLGSSASVSPAAWRTTCVERIASTAASSVFIASSSVISGAKSTKITDKNPCAVVPICVTPSSGSIWSSNNCSTKASCPASNSGSTSTTVLTKTRVVTTCKLLKSIRLPGTLPTSVNCRFTLYSGRIETRSSRVVSPVQETFPPMPTRRVSKAAVGRTYSTVANAASSIERR